MSKTYKRNSYRKPKQYGRTFDKKKEKGHLKEKPKQHFDPNFDPAYDPNLE